MMTTRLIIFVLLAGAAPSALAQRHELGLTLAKGSRHSYVSAYEIALIYESLGENEAASQWLERAVEERSGFIFHVGQRVGLPG